MLAALLPRRHRFLALIAVLLIASGALFAGGADASQAGAPRQQANGGITIAGRVEINPRYVVLSQTQPTPLDIVLVLDASGSMNWNYDGYGTLSQESFNRGLWQYQPVNAQGVGKPINCEAPEILVLAVGCQSADAWANYQERRIYLAKQLAKQFLESFPWKPNDRAALVTFNGGTTGAPPADPLATLTQVYPSSGLTSNIVGGSGSLADLLIHQAASVNPGSSEPQQLYTTSGASPGALGLRRVRSVLNVPSNGRRERNVILLTNGTFDVSLLGVRSPTSSPNDNFGEGKPISQAVEEAEQLKIDAQRPAGIYAVALSQTFDLSGLTEIASAMRAPFYHEAHDPNVLPDILANITPYVTVATCDPREEGWQTPNISNATDVTGAPTTRVGTVTARDANGNLVATADIKAGGVWQIPNLQPDTRYSLAFAIYYRGLDNEVRGYLKINTCVHPQLSQSP